MTGISALSATTAGGLAIAVGLSGAVDFGCGAVTSASGATPLFADFDTTGTVVFSRVVTLASGYAHLGPVADGLGGFSYAVQPSLDACACTSDFQCGGGSFPPLSSCVSGTCQPCQALPSSGGNIVVTRFAP